MEREESIGVCVMKGDIHEVDNGIVGFLCS
jgi:hypothetical protein